MSAQGAISFIEMRTEAVVGSIRVLNDLLEVTLTISGPEEDRFVTFIIYDGVQIDVSGSRS